jgi:hypothetical protein
MRNRDSTNQRTFMKVTMPHDEKELQRKINNYLFHNKLYMNSPFIDDNTLGGFRMNLQALFSVYNGDVRTVESNKILTHLFNARKASLASRVPSFYSNFNSK